MNRTIIRSSATCAKRNYTTTKNKRTMTDKLVLRSSAAVPQAHRPQGDQVAPAAHAGSVQGQ